MILGDVEETITQVEIDDETYEEMTKVPPTPHPPPLVPATPNPQTAEESFLRHHAPASFLSQKLDRFGLSAGPRTVNRESNAGSDR